MRKREFSVRARVAPGVAAGLFAAFTLVGMSGTASAAPKDIKWGTGPAGSSGGKALIVLVNNSQQGNAGNPHHACCPIPAPSAP